MPEINISDSDGRDAMVSAVGVAIPRLYRWIDGDGLQVIPAKILRSTMDFDLDVLVEKFGEPEDVARALVDGDPEVDMEHFGSFLEDTSRVFVSDEDGSIVHRISQIEIVHAPDGSELERRPKKVLDPNVAVETPLRWTGKLLKKSDVFNKFVFSGKVQIGHVNGLTYDFLFNMAKELDDKKSLLLLGGGPKGNEPLVFRRGGLAYRGFLEGRIDGEKYALLLHLSNMELKAPPKPPEAEEEEQTQDSASNGEKEAPAKKKKSAAGKKAIAKKKAAAKKKGAKQ